MGHCMLSVKGGKIIDMRTLKVRDRTFDDYYRWKIPTSYTGRFATGSFNLSLIDFARKFVSYSTTCLTAEQKLIICHGSRSNDKTMFLEFIKKTLGNFYAAANKSI